MKADPVFSTHSLLKCGTAKLLIIALFLITAVGARAITIVSGPSFAPASNAPLAGILELTTDEGSRVSVQVSDGTNTWRRDFHDFSTAHSVPLLGFKPDRTNQILVTVYDKYRNSATASQTLTFVTDPLPADFPHYDILKDEPDRMEPGYTLFIIHNGIYGSDFLTIMDNFGEVVWYEPWTSGDSDVRQLANGNLFIEEQKPANDFQEINMLGETASTLSPPEAYPINPHDAFVTDHGTILYISDVSKSVPNFPSNSTDPNATRKTAKVDDNPIVEISYTNGALLNVWSPLDLLDPTRVTVPDVLFPFDLWCGQRARECRA